MAKTYKISISKIHNRRNFSFYLHVIQLHWVFNEILEIKQFSGNSSIYIRVNGSNSFNVFLQSQVDSDKWQVMFRVDIVQLSLTFYLSEGNGIKLNLNIYYWPAMSVSMFMADRMCWRYLSITERKIHSKWSLFFGNQDFENDIPKRILHWSMVLGHLNRKHVWLSK